MKLLNLINLDKSEVKYNLTRFPDGEPNITITDELDRKNPIEVVCRISNTDDLFVLLQVGDILDRQEMVWYLSIKYLMSMRMDRVMDFNRPFSLKIVCRMISSMNYQVVKVLEPHSYITELLLGSRYEKDEFDYSCHFNVYGNTVIVFPDKGAKDRFGDMHHSHIKYLSFSKVRDLSTGKIKSFEIDKDQLSVLPKLKDYNFVFIDDLCDAGGTFLGELEVLKNEYPSSEYSIIVTHMVNRKGIENLSSKFDKVLFTNSYQDWTDLPENCEMINIF